MNSITEYNKQSELALASYANLIPGVDPIPALQDNAVGMSSTQANKFVEKWQVVSQYIDDTTGLSATVFEDKETGAKHLAVRGTEPTGQDILADGLLAGGLPSTLNPQFIALRSKLNNDWLTDPEILQGQSFTVSGHSLGGYLAAAAKQSYTQVTDAYLYNAPGVGGLLGNLADALGSLFGMGSISPDNIWNIRGSEGFSIIAGLGYQLGTQVRIQTEATSNTHSISLLTDALAVYSLYSQLFPGQSIEQLTEIIDAFGSTKDAGLSNKNTFEFALDALRTIIQNPGNGRIVLDDTFKTVTDNRESFYVNLQNLLDHQKFKDLSGIVQVMPFLGMNAGDIFTMAAGNDAQGLATRFALTALNPFVLASVDYTALNTDGALDLLDPVNGAGTITDQYLIDRATLLTRKLWFNTNDENPYNPSAQVDIHNFNIHQYLKSDIYFEDAATGYKIQQGALFGNTPRYFFGSDAAETPAGSASKDRLYGGGGDDTFQGLEGHDYLEGGRRADTYIINQGDGIDTILDVGGFCVIQFDTVVERDRTVIANDSNRKTGDRGAIHA